MLLHGSLAFTHQGPNGGRRGVEDVYLVAFDDIPEAAEIRIIGNAFEHQAGGAVEERTIDDVGMAGDPADVRGAPEDLAGAIIEDVMEGRRGPHGIAARGVEHALRLSRRSRRVQDEQRILGRHRLAGTIVRNQTGELVIIMIASADHLDRLAKMANDDDGVDLGAFAQSFVDIGLQRHELAAALAAIGGDDEAAGAILDPAVQCFGGETAEDDAVNGADPGAGEHRHRGLRNHRHVQGYAIALGGPQRLQDVRHPNNFGVEIAVSQRTDVAGLVTFPQDRFLLRSLGEMTVDAIITEVENPVFEPAYVYRIERPVADPGRLPVPVQPLCLLRPEAVRVLDRAAVERIILVGSTMAVADSFARWRDAFHGGSCAPGKRRALAARCSGCQSAGERSAPARPYYWPRIRSRSDRRRRLSGCGWLPLSPRIIASMSIPSMPM